MRKIQNLPSQKQKDALTRAIPKEGLTVVVESVATNIEPVLDPRHVGRFLSSIDSQLPMDSDSFFGLIAGEYPSRMPGRGMDYNGLRDYELSDDASDIDQNATALNPMGVPVVRQRYREITPSLWVVTDIPSNRYVSGGGYFSEQILGLSALAAILKMAEDQDIPTSAIAVSESDKIVHYEPENEEYRALKVTKQIAELIIKGESNKESEPRHNLAYALKLAAQHAIDSAVVVVSDFRDVFDPKDEKDGWLEGISRLKANGNSIISIELINPWDRQTSEYVDEHYTGGGYVNLGSRKGRKERAAYLKRATEMRRSINDALDAPNTSHIPLLTVQPMWLTDLKEKIEWHAKRAEHHV